MNRGLHWALWAVFAITLSSCKKTVAAKEEDLLISIITSGIWVVESYVENGSTITSDFTGYEFKFEKSGTVTGTVNGVISSGTWSGSTATRSISSNFPSSGAPLNKLNGTWLIVDAGPNFVKANAIISAANCSIYLYKKP
jgi:hypothetical protein